MALVFLCDGCGTPQDKAALTAFGYIEAAYYCPSCGQVYRALLAEEAQQRTDIVGQFEAWRKQRWADVRGHTLKKLPDE